MRAPFGPRVTSKVLTGVAKSTTSKRRAYASGRAVSGKSITMRPPSCLRLACTRGSLVVTRMRPAPSAPRRKSTLSIDGADVAVAALGVLPRGVATGADCAAKLVPWPMVTYTTLPATRVW